MRIFTKIFFVFLSFMTITQSAEFPEFRRTEKELFPRPQNGAVSEVNPPAFVWLPVKDAVSYTVTIFSSNGIKFEHKVAENLLVLESPLEPGEYTWTITAINSHDEILSSRRAYSLTIDKEAPQFPYPNIEKLVATIKPHHPRLIFDKNKIKDIRSTLTSTRRNGWLAVKRMADESLELDRLVPPWYGDIEDYNTRRIEYRRYYRYLRPFIDEGLQSLSLAWLMTGDKKYADKAKEILFTAIEWSPHGINSSNHIGFDEPGLSYARCMHRVYDWLYDALTEEEKALVKQYVIERARDTWTRVGENRPFLKNPGSSHDGRLIGYLGEQALVLAGEAPDDEVAKWLDHSLKAFWTVFPHWAGVDGGWAEGIGYAAAYNIRAATWIESFVNTVDLDMWQKPFFQKIRTYFLYCARPNDEFWAFGDGAERGPRLNPSRALILKSLMAHYGRRFNDPASQWWADQVPLAKGDISSPVVPLILGEETKGEAPKNLPQAALFRDVGWAGLHSDMSDIDNDVFFLFKSSPYGSISHSHADQNSFYLSVGGRALAIPSGYYGPVYGMPHHADWTRSTKANNSILVNGKGQVVRDFTATGSIRDFVNTEKMTYFCGDAAPAYKGALTTFDRHVLFLRPGLFVILDDLKAVEPSTFQWMLHSLDKMNVDVSAQKIEVLREDAKAEFTLFSSAHEPLTISQTDLFDTPFNAGTDSVYHVQVDNHWHVTAETKSRRASLRIAAFLNAGKKMPEMSTVELNGWSRAIVRMSDGTAQLWAKLNSDATLPNELAEFSDVVIENADVVGIWRPVNGKVQILTNGH